MNFISILSIFVMACFVGTYLVWRVTPALHMPLINANFLLANQKNDMF